MDQDSERIAQKLTELEGKVDAVYRSSEKMRKYFLWAFIITAAAIVIPLVLLPLVIPAFLQSVSAPAGF